ncbi:MAG: ComEA family DNA-binding protein [Thermodesulfobacteriota bacterium]
MLCRIVIAFLCVFIFGPALALAALNINLATEQELATLKGIGPVKAKAIVEDRQKNGPFRSVAELDRVKGIGPKTVQTLGDSITVSGGDSKGVDWAGARTPAYPGTITPVPGYKDRWVNY